MNDIQRLTVYLGSSGRCRPVFKEEAANLGFLIGHSNKTLVYGGMDSGLMGIVANNALDAGGRVTGIIPKKLKDSERIHPRLSETILVPDLWERKRKMFKRADAIIVLAGGFGTIDEALEALYWTILKSHAKPIVFVNTENYWDDFLAFLKTLPDLSPDMYHVVKNGHEAVDFLAACQTRTASGDPENLPHFEDDILPRASSEPLIIDKATVKDSYILATALGLKQLDKHSRPIGLLNTEGQFDALLRWIDLAEKERFITDRCKMLFQVDSDLTSLKKKLKDQTHIRLDLETEKWGPSETGTHITITETP